MWRDAWGSKTSLSNVGGDIVECDRSTRMLSMTLSIEPARDLGEGNGP